MTVGDDEHSHDDLRDRLVKAALPHAPFDGWSEATLRQAAQETGLGLTQARRLFPDAGRDLVSWCSCMADRSVVTVQIDGLKVRDRIRELVLARLLFHAQDREAIRRAAAFLLLPENAPLGARLLGATVDRLWAAAGDDATDGSYYSKRLILAGVYASTFLVWLDDGSEDNHETRDFLDRRIAQVMALPRYSAAIRAVAGFVPRRVRALRAYGRQRS